MEKKICSKCKKKKHICEFGTHKKNKDGKRYACKECENAESKKWKENNKDKVLELNKIYSKNNKKKFLESQKKYYNNNKEKVIKRIVEYQKNKIKEDNLFKLKKTIQRTIRRYIKNKRFTTTEIIGCDYDSFKIYFESLFTEGMCWDKLGSEIHIDHIIPLSSAKTKDELYKLNHYTNLQPLWAKDNLIKGSKLL
jgi:hypothetical protein